MLADTPAVFFLISLLLICLSSESCLFLCIKIFSFVTSQTLCLCETVYLCVVFLILFYNSELFLAILLSKYKERNGMGFEQVKWNGARQVNCSQGSGKSQEGKLLSGYIAYFFNIKIMKIKLSQGE